MSLPKWPERSFYEHESRTYFGKPIVYKRYEAYERARADAAIARLKVAVALLKEIADNPGYDNVYSIDADKALKDIGEIPP